METPTHTYAVIARKDFPCITHPVMRYHGGKFRLAPWIISHFPEHYTYVEPYSGAASVLMTKTPSCSEVYNDIDDDIVNVFKILRDDILSAKLTNQIALTPFSRSDFNIAFHHSENSVERARRTLIRSHMGFGSGSVSIESNSGFRLDSYRKPCTGAGLWAKYPLLIRQFCQRLKGVIIENRDALKVIDNHDRADTLFYIDPPYLHSTRNKDERTKVYDYEMNDHDHTELLVKIKKLAGMVILSGYDSPNYNLELPGWTKRQKNVQASSNRGSTNRIECLWLNPACGAAVLQKQLF